MSKGRKKTKGLAAMLGSSSPYKEPTPAERTEHAAEHLLREAIEGDPKFKRVARSIAATVRRGASKLVRGATPRRGDPKALSRRLS